MMTRDSSAGVTSGYLNGVVQGTLESPISTVDAPVTIGLNGNGYSNGNFAEMLIYDRLLSAAERQQMEAYLNYKWYGVLPPNDDILPSNTAVAIDSGAGLDLNGLSQTIGALSGEGTVNLNGGSLTVQSTADSTFDGSIVGVGSLTKTGSETLHLSGSNSYTGGTLVEDGLLVVDSSDALANGDLTIGAGGRVELSGVAGKAIRIRSLTMPLGGGLAGATASAPSVNAVPEPSTLALLMAGAVALAAAAWRRRYGNSK